MLAIELHDNVQPGAADIVTACFPPDLFERTRHGELDLFQRRVPLCAISPPAARELHLINGEPGLFPFVLRDALRAAWGFFSRSTAIRASLATESAGREAGSAWCFRARSTGSGGSSPPCTMPGIRRRPLHVHADRGGGGWQRGAAGGAGAAVGRAGADDREPAGADRAAPVRAADRDGGGRAAHQQRLVRWPAPRLL